MILFFSIYPARLTDGNKPMPDIATLPQENVYQPDKLSPSYMTVNGEQIMPVEMADLFDFDFYRDEWLDAVRTMLRNEHGDLSRAPVHYRLVRDNLPIKRERPPSFYDWKINSADLAKAEKKATAWLAAAGPEELQHAVGAFDKVMVKILLEAGTEIADQAMVRLAILYGRDNLDNFMRRVRREILELMLTHGLDPCFKFFIKHNPWMMLNHLCANEAPAEDIELLLTYGAQAVVNHRDKDGNTPLLCYAGRTYHSYKCPPNKKGFIALLERGADISMVNNKNEGVVQLLMGNDDRKYRKIKLQLAEYLVNHGAESPGQTKQQALLSNAP